MLLGVLLRFEDDGVDVGDPRVSWFAEAHRTGHIRDVAAGARADVDLQELACLDAPIGRHGMRHAGIRSAGDDRWEAGTVGVLDQIQLDLARDLFLGEARLDTREDVGQTTIEHVDRVLQLGELLGVFDDAQVVDELLLGHQLD